MVPKTNPKFVTLAEAGRITSMSPNSFNRLEIVDETFPRIARISPRKALINLEDLEAWIVAQVGKKALPIRERAEAAQ
jgi:hypothetical protein